MNKIKELGLEKEFKKWLKDVKKRDKGFCVGSRVELKENLVAFPYSYGDKGEVLRVGIKNSGQAILKVKFDKDKEILNLWSSRFKLIK